MIARTQLLELGYGDEAIRHRVAQGRLHRVFAGVYTVGRPDLSRMGMWMAAVLSCGPTAALSHRAGGALWEICPESERIDVSVAGHVARRRPGIVVHRRTALRAADYTRRDGIPVTAPVCTLIDLAARLGRADLEAAINEADRRGLTNPEALRAALPDRSRRPGVAFLRATLDRRTFRLTDSELERRFLSLVRSTGLPAPQTGVYLNGFKVDFHWPDLGLVVETDGLRYHRTPAQQARDRRRDQSHAAAGLTALRFTHEQVTHEPDHVRTTFAAVAARLAGHSG